MLRPYHLFSVERHNKLCQQLQYTTGITHTVAMIHAHKYTEHNKIAPLATTSCKDYLRQSRSREPCALTSSTTSRQGGGTGNRTLRNQYCFFDFVQNKQRGAQRSKTEVLRKGFTKAGRICLHKNITSMLPHISHNHSSAPEHARPAEGPLRPLLCCFLVVFEAPPHGYET